MIRDTSINQHQRNRRLAKLLCMGLLIQGLTACQDAEKPYPSAGEAFPLSAIELMTPVAGSGINFEGKTLLINFWATWCTPCREEMPALQQLSDSLDPERFAVIGISVDQDPNLIREFMLHYDIRFPVFQDDKLQLASELLLIETFPETFVVSPQGVITRRIGEALAPDFNLVEPSTASGVPANAIKFDSGTKG